MQNMSAINWWWIIPAVACDILGYVFQGLRWQMLLRHLGSISILDATKAVYAGLFTNEILPLRIGELVRTYLVARWLSILFVAVIPSVVIERLFDGIWLGIVLGITAIILEEFPEELLLAADDVGIAVLLMTALFLYLIVFRRQKRNSIQDGKRISWRPLRIIVSFFRQISDEIHDLGASKFFYLSFFVSSLVLISQILAFWFVMLGYGLNSSFLVGTAVFLFIRLGSLLPNAPSNVGTYQFLCVTGLMFFGVDKLTSAAFSVVVFIIITVPLWAVGLFAIGHCGLTTKQIRDEIKKVIR
jgi:glycosyltransferase 2 family protein